jgi:hypothetical protein
MEHAIKKCNFFGHLYMSPEKTCLKEYCVRAWNSSCERIHLHTDVLTHRYEKFGVKEKENKKEGEGGRERKEDNQAIGRENREWRKGREHTWAHVSWCKGTGCLLGWCAPYFGRLPWICARVETRHLRERLSVRCWALSWFGAWKRTLCAAVFIRLSRELRTAHCVPMAQTSWRLAP